MSLTIESSFLWNETVWNPSMIQTALWLDAADASTVTTVSGAVSQWNDKSGNGRHATQNTTYERPTYEPSGLNSKPTLSFDGSTDFMAIGGAALPLADNTNNFDIFIVAAPDLTGRNSIWGAGYLKSYTVSENDGSWFAGYYDTGRLSLNHQLAGITSANVKTAENTLTSSASAIITYRYMNSGASSSDRWSMQLNAGSDLAKTTSSSASSWIAERVVGRSYTGSNYYVSGKVSEIIMTASTLSNTNKQKVEGYLAHKWGLEANLPAGHPYKNYGPKP